MLRSVLLCALILINGPHLWGQLGPPVLISPVGPSPQFPPFIWTAVPGATKYRVELYAVEQKVLCTPLGVTFAGGLSVATVTASARCQNGSCGFKGAPPYQNGVIFGGPGAGMGWGDDIRGPKDCRTGNPIVFKWRTQALNETGSGPFSDFSSFSRAEPSAPSPPPPPKPTYVFTCVFKSGNALWAWYNGVALGLVNSAGQFNPSIIGQTVSFAPTPYYDCTNVFGGGVPVGETSMKVTSVSLCTNLISGAQETLVNATCPN